MERPFPLQLVAREVEIILLQTPDLGVDQIVRDGSQQEMGSACSRLCEICGRDYLASN